MAQVTVKANMRLLGLRYGQETTVERTALIRALLASGKLTEVAAATPEPAGGHDEAAGGGA